MTLSNWVDWCLAVCLPKLGFFVGFLCRKTSKLAGDLIGSVFAYLVPVIIVLVRNIFRSDDKLICSSATHQPSSEAVSVDAVKSADSEKAEVFNDDSSEEDTPKLVFKFQSYEDFIRNKGENGDTDEPVTLPSFRKFIEESGDEKSDAKQACEISKVETLDSVECFADGFLCDKDFVHPSCEEQCDQVDESESRENVLQKVKDVETELGSIEVCVEKEAEKEAAMSLKSGRSESMVSEDELADISCADESITDGFLSDGDFMPYLEQYIDNESSLDSLEDDVDSMENDDELAALKELECLLKSESKDQTLENEKDNFDDEYDNMLQDLDAKSDNADDIVGSDFLSEDDFGCDQEIPDSEMESNWEEDDEDLETLWEHQDILEQLSIEIKNVRATGLPTIDEHTEISKFSENLKPWKIEEKFQPGDRFSMVHKFYRSYWGKMRKLDILSYQKMYAIGLLQSKDSLKSASGDKSEAPAFALFNSSWRNKNRKIEAEPMMKFIRELHNDLELVYVGQMCLSWDILHWQYEKALELWEADRHCLRRFNLVCSEFQQFQVLLQRFVEDEQYQGPRVQTYVKSRRSLHNLLLQVPVIREDKKGKKKGSPSNDEPLSSDILVESMEESIRTFWKFLRADKHEPTGKRISQCELQEPADYELLSELTKTLQKKERKLKDVLRTGNCILKKFKRRPEDDHSDQVLCFFSQVDIRLVARVLCMSRLSMEQLQWCGNKLSSINFVNGRIQVEPSFSLFPC